MASTEKPFDLSALHRDVSEELQDGYNAVNATNHVRSELSRLMDHVLRMAHESQTERLSSLLAVDLRKIGNPLGDPFGEIEHYIENHLIDTYDPEDKFLHFQSFLDNRLPRMTVVLLGPLVQQALEAVEIAFDPFQRSWSDVHRMVCPNENLHLIVRKPILLRRHGRFVVRADSQLTPPQWQEFGRDMQQDELQSDQHQVIRKIGKNAWKALQRFGADMAEAKKTNDITTIRLQRCLSTTEQVSIDCAKHPDNMKEVTFNRFVNGPNQIPYNRFKAEDFILGLNWEVCADILDALEVWQLVCEELERKYSQD